MFPDATNRPLADPELSESRGRSNADWHQEYPDDPKPPHDSSRIPSSSAKRFGDLKVAVLPFDQLSPETLARWEHVRHIHSDRPQPFFAARFAQAVHQARGDVFVAVLTDSSSCDANAAIGFLPFHRRGRVGVPVGRFLNDAQNVVGLAPSEADWSLLMRACQVVGFDLHAIVDPAPQWIGSYGLQSVGSYQADFAGDSAGYLKRLEREHRTIGKQGQKTRKLGREIGEVRLEVDCRSADVLARAIQWKRDQYQRTHILDLFLPDWTRRLIELLHAGDGYAPAVAGQGFQSTDLRGLLSVLWAGNQVVAAHYGMIEKGRLHYWFPTYDPQFSQYSPGTALFTELVRCASEDGIDCIDMGYGEQPYKQKQTGTASAVAFGTITDSRWHRLAYNVGTSLTRYVKRMPMKEQAKKAWRAIHPTAGINKLS